jgi:hypothetical protein
MKNWLIGGLITAANAAFDSISGFASFYVFSPKLAEDPAFWKGMGLFILINVAKTMAHYLKTPPKVA